MTDLTLPKVEPAVLDEEDIHFVIREELKNSADFDTDELESNHEDAYRYYKVDPRPGDERRRGRSLVQSSDVSDAIEWILPTVIKSFMETPDVVRFDPVNPQDVPQAELESDYVHHVFMKQCNGFQVLYEFVKDALLLKNAVTYTYWCEERKQRLETFENYDEQELELLLNPLDNAEARLESLTPSEEVILDPERGEAMLDPQTGQPMTRMVYSGRVRYIDTQGKPEIEVCVPERFKVRDDHGSIDLSRARFLCYSMPKPVSDLLAAGYDSEKVRECPTAESDDRFSLVKQAREDVEENAFPSDSAIEAADASQRMVTVHRCYCLLDVNGDGLEERYMVVLGGDEGEVLLDYYEVDECPFTAGTPFIASHKFWGYSIYDKLKQIQDLKTKFLRMIADNGDFINNPEKKVNPALMRIEDALVKRAGALKRVDDPSAYEELPPPALSQVAYSVLEWADKMRGERVGVDPDAQSVSKIMPDEAMNSAMERLLTAKEEVVNLIIRVFAEIWFAPLMLRLRKLLMTHMRRDVMTQVYGKWVQIDPRNWEERHVTTVKVGLGTGDRLKKMMALEKVIAFQQAEMAGGQTGVTLTPSKRVHAYTEFIRSSGLGDPEEYWLNPLKTEMEIQQMGGNPQAAPSPEAFEAFLERQKAAQAAQAAQQQQAGPAGPDPQALMAIEQTKGQFRLQEKQMELQARQQEKQVELAARQQEMTLSTRVELMTKRMEQMAEQQQFIAENTRKWAELFEKAGTEAEQLIVKASEARIKARQAAAQEQAARIQSKDSGGEK